MQQFVYGLHAALAVLDKQDDDIEEVLVQANVGTNARLRRLEQRAKQKGLIVTRMPRKQLDEIVGTSRHQGVVLRCRERESASEDMLEDLIRNLKTPALLLVLDGIQDPHNLGACLRTAEAAGVHAVIAPKDRAVGLTPTVRKVSVGASERVPFVQVTNLARTLEQLQGLGVWITGTSAVADKSIFASDLTGDVALVIGGEEKGLRQLTQEHCDFLVKIPMLGDAESLNASVAAAVCLFEARRQRMLF
ncbi:MAG: 23S rRNA (guanosine(2251)-2'-O)-methyltransferase RlmB [Gammaproteobacteria bacterium]|nr:23S rRNA (guanosine(2251)-2'-O)-methyltransferase RlmB [Gammaproteobacteria bacterium]